MTSDRTRIPYGSGRQAIIDAVLRVVARDGMSAVTTRALTAESGMSQGALQHHFGTVDGVFAAALEYSSRVIAENIGPSTTLEGIFDGIVGMLRDHPELSTFQTEMFLEARRVPHLAALVARYQDQYAENLRVAIRAQVGEPSESLVHLLMAVGDGIAYEVAMQGERQLAVADRQIEALRRILRAISDGRIPLD
ncbi:MAG TPA: TetR/AcrR family transcriptional regulator [Pseudolysinimonas sp.]|nr:TetR/AcrR family transcriptional regulator [Pseudolysinimonas sp.]